MCLSSLAEEFKIQLQEEELHADKLCSTSLELWEDKSMGSQDAPLMHWNTAYLKMEKYFQTAPCMCHSIFKRDI